MSGVLSLLHVSDIHFGPPYVEAVGDALIDAAHAVKPDIVVASGDFTQRAKREQYAAARQFLDRLPRVPTITVPGNHDIPLYRVFERLFSPYALYHEYIDRELEGVYRVEGAVIVALNSTNPLRAITNGRIRTAHIERCEEAFRSAGDGVARIVVAHHHFAPAPDYEGGQVMPGGKWALDRLTSLKVDLILGGHLHRAYIGNSLDVYPGSDREHGIIIVQAGTATSRRGRAREREKNSFNMIRISDEIVRITHYMFFDDLGTFAPMSRHIFPRAGSRYFRETSAVTAGTD